MMSDDWNESPFNDPRQLGMDFSARPEDDFSLFHKKNPHIWREFRHLVLDKVNSGQKKIAAKEILKVITSGTALREDLVKQYQELFISNHQELEHVFESPTPDSQKK